MVYAFRLDSFTAKVMLNPYEHPPPSIVRLFFCLSLLRVDDNIGKASSASAGPR